LGTDELAVDQSFFDAGGDSLLATFAADEISRELALTVSVHDIYSHQTIEALGAHIETLAHESSAA